jgi:5-methylthioadenosine/S-adenosylhomocysteine deaminase
MDAMSVGGASQVEQCDILITNATVITIDSQRHIFTPGAIAVRGDRILDVGDEAEVCRRYRSTRTFDALGAVVHPGFIDAHTHVGILLTRGAFSDSNATNDTFPHYARWLNENGAEDEYASAQLASLEMLSNGITMFIDPGTLFEPDAAADAVRAVGIRATFGDPFVWDVPDFEWAQVFTRVRADTDSAIKRLGGQLWRNANPDDLVSGHIALYGLGSATDQLTIAAKQCADQHKVVFTQHQSFERRDAVRDDARFSAHALRHFRDIGVLGHNVTFAHLNYVRADELDAVVDSGMSIAWNPGNFLFYSVGVDHTVSQVPGLFKRGVNVALGTDTAKVWSYGEQGLIGYLLARQSGVTLPADAALEMATIGGARALGMQELLGSLEPGKRADIIIRSNHLPEAHPGLNPVRDTALLLRTKGVDTVLVNGRIVFRRGHSTQVDEGAVFDRARKSARSMMRRVGLA